MWSNDFISIPFQDHGRTREGSDCWGLARIIYRERLNIDLPSYDEDYKDVFDRQNIADRYAEHKLEWQPVPIGQEKEYDLAVFRMLNLPTHVAIVIKPTLMIHCERGCGTYVTDYIDDRNWSRRLEGFYRYAGNSNNPSTISSR
jgi:cell wall-associated NlpC family hydrolase